MAAAMNLQMPWNRNTASRNATTRTPIEIR